MNGEQIISKLKELRQVKPDADWVYVNKTELLGADPIKSNIVSSIVNKFTASNGVNRPRFSFKAFVDELKREERFVLSHKLAFSILTVCIAFIGVFGFALTSVPGDSLFQLRKIAEQGQSYFVSNQDQPRFNLDLASKRLDDLTRIAEENEVENLAVAIDEYQKTVDKTAKSLKNIDNSYIIEKLTDELKELEIKENQIKSLGIEIGQNEELGSVLARVVEKEILEMESAGLTEEDLEVLNNVKFEYEQGNYSRALELLLLK